MDHFAGLDVSVKDTSVCIVDDLGKIVREVKVESEPEALLAVLRSPAYRDRERRRHPQHRCCFHRSLPRMSLLLCGGEALPKIASLGGPPRRGVILLLCAVHDDGTVD